MMDMNEINEKQDGLLIFISIIGIVLFITLLDKALNEYKKKDRELSLAALFFAFLALAIAIGVNFAIDDPSKKLIKFNLDFNTNEFKEVIVSYLGYAWVVVILAAFYFIGRLIYLYKLSKNASKMFSRYNSIIEKYNAKEKPIQDHKAEIFKIDSKLINPLDPELWSKNVAYYFVESEKDNGF